METTQLAPIDDAALPLGDAAISPPAPAVQQLQFTGSGSEYFRIWIVNLALTILTLGIYSAWAKVRRVQYFYRNTQLAGSGFQFHGSPVAILKGRIIALVIFGAYYGLEFLSKPIAIGVGVALMAALPWLIHRALMFRRHNTSYRGLRFRFEHTLKESYLVFLPTLIAFIVPTLLLLSFDLMDVANEGNNRYFALSLAPLLLWPYFHWRQTRFAVSGSSFASSAFSFVATVKNFYARYAKFVVVTLGFAPVMVLVIVVVFGGVALAGISLNNLGTVGAMVVGFLAIFLAFLSLAPYYLSRLQNLTWNNTALGGERFASHATMMAMYKIQIVNTLLTVVTLGLYRPFAVIKMLKYRVECVSFAGDVDAFVSNAAAQSHSAAGQETADFLGIDLGL